MPKGILDRALLIGRYYRISLKVDIPLVIDVFRDRSFWKEEFGICDAPQARDLGSSKLVTVRKTAHISP